MRSVWGTYPEYHTSADNLEFIRPAQLGGSLQVCIALVDVLEGNRRFRNLNPFCEPQLGKRNLYQSHLGEAGETEVSARRWVLNLSDGTNSLLDIATRSGLDFSLIRDAADLLQEKELLAPLADDDDKGFVAS
jgi:aminopeptidase-like protein